MRQQLQKRKLPGLEELSNGLVHAIFDFCTFAFGEVSVVKLYPSPFRILPPRGEYPAVDIFLLYPACRVVCCLADEKIKRGPFCGTVGPVYQVPGKNREST